MAALADTEIDSDISIRAAEKSYNRFLIDCQAEENGGYIELPVFFYRGYQATDIIANKSFEVGKGNNNKLRITIPPNYEGRLDIQFKEPWYWRGAEIISLAVVLYYCGAGAWRLRRRRR